MVKLDTLEQIKKRDGRVVAFDQSKIVAAIMKAAQAVQGSDYRLAERLAAEVVAALGRQQSEKIPSVEAIQDAIEKVLIEHGHARTAKAFILYRSRRSRIREGKSELMETVSELLHNAGAPVASGAPATRLHAIGLAASREYYLNRLLPEAIAEAHLAGEMHIHGLGHYAKLPHALALPFEALLGRGFRSGHALVRPPRRADSAAALTCLALQAAQAETFGGQAIAGFDTAFARVLPESQDAEAIAQSMEALVFALNAQAAGHAGRLPLASLAIGADPSPRARLVASALLEAFEAGLGRGEAALRPHLVFVLREGVNLAGGDPNADLLRRAARVAATRPGITFVHDQAAYAGHEARLESPLQVARVSLNLPRLALRSRRDRRDFLGLLDEALDLAVAQLQHRFEVLAERPLADFPFTFGQPLLAGADGLGPQDAVRPVLAHGQLAIGLVGLAETLVVLAGTHHGGSPSGQAEGLAIVKRLYERCAQLSTESGLNLVLQSSDAAEVGDRFARLDRREFGWMRGITDAATYSDGIALPADAEVSAADRLAIEGAYVPFLAGGAWHKGRLDAAPTPEAVLAWIHQAVAAGQRAFSLELLRCQCASCGLTAAPAEICPRCEASLAGAPALVRRRGYLSLGES
ncbi:MAG TPA: anaerobic ribonucleoside-triphosphate reductase [Oscillatoriaceae cyanobacterium]